MINFKPTPFELQQLETVFNYHQPKEDQPETYSHLRTVFKALALELLTHCPPSRERVVAMTKLEETLFWANASIARNT